MDYDYQNAIKQIIPLSPQASMMQRFGNYPVDYSTGVPNISVPLYTVKIADYELPISIDYHNSGVRVQDIATPVGLGWVLNAGGCINRTVMGTDDMNASSVPYCYPFLSTAEAASLVAQSGIFQESSYWDALSSGNIGDTQVDRYNFNFSGNSGTFRYDIRNGRYKTIPYTDMKIEAYDERYAYNCKVFSFKITDHNGIEYYFEYPEYAREDVTNGASTHATSYYLTKILHSNKKDSIELIYEDGCKFYTQRNVGYRSKGDTYHISSNGSGLSVSLDTPYNHSSTHTTEQSETLLREIRWNGNSMSFNYDTDRPEDILYTTTGRMHRMNSAVVKNNEGDTVRTVMFFNDNYTGTNSLERRMFLSSVTIGGSGTTSGETYTFEYNTISLPSYYRLGTGSGNHVSDLMCHEDFWGYYNGSTSQSWIPQDYAGANVADGMRWVNNQYAKAGSLSSVTYPTGGKTVYEMESNQLGDNTLWGGLRVKSIKDYDSDGELIRKRTYKYENACPSVGLSDFSRLFNYDVEHTYYYSPSGSLISYSESSLHNVAVSNPCIPLSADYGSPVYYHKVTEYHGTENENDGFNIYQYEDGHTNYISTYSLDDMYEYTSNPVQFYSEWGNLDSGHISVLLIFEGKYDGLGNLCASKSYNYQDVMVDTFRLGTRVQMKVLWTNYHDGTGNIDNSSVYSYSNGNTNTFPSWWDSNFSVTDILAIPSYKRLSSTTEYQDGLSTETTYEYDDGLRVLTPKSITTPPHTLTFTYPFECSDPIAARMTGANMIVPLKKCETRNGTVVRTDSIAYGTVAEGIQPVERYTSIGGNTLEKRLTYSYDNKGRITCISTDAGENTVFLWGGRNDFPIAKIEGLTPAGIINIVGTGVYDNLSSNAPSEYQLYTAWEMLRQHGYPMTIYTHETLVGLKSVLYPNHSTMSFDYDFLGRPIRKKENADTREVYEYNYAH